LHENSQLDDSFDFDRSLQKQPAQKKNKFALNMLQVQNGRGFQDEFEENIENLSESWQEKIRKEKR